MSVLCQFYRLGGLSLKIPFILKTWVLWNLITYKRLLENLLTTHTLNSLPAAGSLQFQEAIQLLVPVPLQPNDIGTRFLPISHSVSTSLHGKGKQWKLDKLAFEQRMCQSVLGTRMGLAPWSTLRLWKVVYKWHDWHPINRNSRERIKQSCFFWSMDGGMGKGVIFYFSIYSKPQSLIPTRMEPGIWTQQNTIS